MGCYINPENESKESFLIREGEQILYPCWADKPAGSLPVCLVQNRGFTGAGIAYSEKEMKAFIDPYDARPKKWFYVPIHKLAKVSAIEDYLSEEAQNES